MTRAHRGVQRRARELGFGWNYLTQRDDHDVLVGQYGNIGWALIGSDLTMRLLIDKTSGHHLFTITLR